MKKEFRVTLIVKALLYQTVVVEADDEDEAGDLAKDQVGTYPSEFDDMEVIDEIEAEIQGEVS